MRIQYLQQSGFLIELNQSLLLFDYWQGQLPALDETKDLYVFVSHRHRDHYNHEIWKLRNRNKRTVYIIAKEIPFSPKQQALLGLQLADETEQISQSLVYYKPNTQIANTFVIRTKERQSFDLTKEFGLSIETLKSTDLGVAFYIEIEGKRIYHAGDLNNWSWLGETKEYNHCMEQAYLEELKLFAPKEIDVAFLPFDPRQEKFMGKGFMQFLKLIKVHYAIPMHFWKRFSKVETMLKEIEGTYPNTKIIKLQKSLQEIEII